MTQDDGEGRQLGLYIPDQLAGPEQISRKFRNSRSLHVLHMVMYA